MSDGDRTDGGLSELLYDTNERSEIVVLLVDDDPSMLDLTATFLERERDEFTVISESFGDEALERLERERVDAIVSDYDMPKMNGLDFLENVRQDHPDTPFVLFTGKGSEEIASEAISKGVTDYLQKETNASQYSVLANRLLNAVERYRASESLKRSEEKFSKLVTNSTDVISVVDESARFKYISPACKWTLGYEQEELIGECAFDYMPPNDRMDAMESFFEGIEDPSYEPVIEFRFEDPEGGWSVVEARGKNLFDDEFIQGYVVTARDISDLKKREQELRQRNGQLSDIQTMITRDLREPLSAAKGFVDLYREDHDESYIDKVSSSLDRMDVLLGQIVTLVENDAQIGATQPLPFEEVVRQAWQTIDANQAKLHIDNSRVLEADPELFQQLVENLLRNAVDHTDDDVIIHVGTTESTLYFEDTGPGVPPSDREEIFESGSTTEPDRNGLGLTIVKQIALGHGWTITATESQAGGARFEVTDVNFESLVHNETT